MGTTIQPKRNKKIKFFIICYTMVDNFHDRLNFDPENTSKIFKNSWKEHLKISKIAVCSGKMSCKVVLRISCLFEVDAGKLTLHIPLKYNHSIVDESLSIKYIFVIEHLQASCKGAWLRFINIEKEHTSPIFKFQANVESEGHCACKNSIF